MQQLRALLVKVPYSNHVVLFEKYPVIKKQDQNIIRNVPLVYLPGFVYDK